MVFTLFELSQEGQKSYSLPASDRTFEDFHPALFLRQSPLPLPEVSAIDLTRYFTTLSRRNMGIDTHFYPLGSCTMKFNPRVNEMAAALPAFQRAHPLAPSHTVKGCLKVIEELIALLCEVCGMAGGSLVPNAGAQGELTGVLMIRAYHAQDPSRIEMLIPDNAHGTNPATASMAGLQVITIKTGPDGDLDLDDLKRHLSPRTAGLMLTNPNTLGLFSPRIQEITQLVREAGGLLYYDGANLNPILEVARPGDMGFDVMHLNLHKTFSTPHGGGGPGAGPVLCQEKLRPFLPLPAVHHAHVHWHLQGSMGLVATFFGNFGIYLRAFLYAKLHGHFGLRRIAEHATLNANYLKRGIQEHLTIPYPQPCMHEFVVQADRFLSHQVRALDIAKRLLDYGFHAPTIYFPLIIKECLLIEPTESESKATLDRFLEALRQILKEAEEQPELLLNAPHTMPVRRLDETKAAKNQKIIA